MSYDLLFVPCANQNMIQAQVTHYLWVITSTLSSILSPKLDVSNTIFLFQYSSHYINHLPHLDPTLPRLLLISSKMFVFSILLLIHVTLTQSKCIPPSVDASTCINPPVVNKVDLKAYQGRWYLIATSEVPIPFFQNRCVTANYTINGPKIDVLNCQHISGDPKPACIIGFAERRPGGSTAQLQVAFGDLPPGPYNVVALLGKSSYGYYAAAVYSCFQVGDRFVKTFFFIARSPYRPNSVFRKLKSVLKCKGFLLDDPFRMTEHPATCKYFDSGFDVRPAGAFLS